MDYKLLFTVLSSSVYVFGCECEIIFILPHTIVMCVGSILNCMKYSYGTVKDRYKVVLQINLMAFRMTVVSFIPHTRIWLHLYIQ